MKTEFFQVVIVVKVVRVVKVNTPEGEKFGCQGSLFTLMTKGFYTLKTIDFNCQAHEVGDNCFNYYNYLKKLP